MATEESTFLSVDYADGISQFVGLVGLVAEACPRLDVGGLLANICVTRVIDTDKGVKLATLPHPKLLRGLADAIEQSAE